LSAGVFWTTAQIIFGAQQQQPQPPPASSPEENPAPSVDEPPEEDDSVKPKIFPFNPLESERNIKVGNFYMRKADYRGALGRYQDASKYNPNSSEAFFRIGQAEEKLKHKDRAKAAYGRATQLESDSKFAKEAKKRLAALG
jgi:tetratricopeptide (TPR) repeat protein